MRRVHGGVLVRYRLADFLFLGLFRELGLLGEVLELGLAQLGLIAEMQVRIAAAAVKSAAPRHVAFALALIPSGGSHVITAVGVCNIGKDEDAVAPVGSSDSRSRNKHRLDGISETFESFGNFFDGVGLFDEVVVNLLTLLE